MADSLHDILTYIDLTPWQSK